LCADLAAFKIPETLSHCDFQFNNMLFDKKTDEINIIDWGETVITQPT
jgi:aminoglycoside phosphotransferase (APT) family kinase protein